MAKNTSEMTRDELLEEVKRLRFCIIQAWAGNCVDRHARNALREGLGCDIGDLLGEEKQLAVECGQNF